MIGQTSWLTAIAVITSLSMGLGIMIGWALARENYRGSGNADH